MTTPAIHIGKAIDEATSARRHANLTGTFEWKSADGTPRHAEHQDVARAHLRKAIFALQEALEGLR